MTTDLTVLTDRQREMIPLLIEAAEIMDQLFWKDAYGDRETLLSSIEDPDLRRFAEINYGPWDRLDGDRPFIEGIGHVPGVLRISFKKPYRSQNRQFRYYP